MNRKKKDKRKKGNRSEISRNLLIRYCLTVIAYGVGIILFVLIAWQVCHLFTWYDDNPLYWILSLIRDNILLICGILFLGGWILISSYFISKPLRYLDEAVAAAEKLVVPTNEPIVLSDAMSYTEKELNRVREKALDNARAAKEAEQRKNDLVMYLAHDLKTPLSSVIGYLTLLKEEQQISEELRERYLSVTLEKAERLEELINEFFEITRFNLSSITLEYGKINLTRLLEQLTFECKPMLADRNLQCELHAAPNIMMQCDVDKLQRVLDNLLRNAIHYSYEGTCITVSAEADEKSVLLKFTNEGNTIPPDKLGRIFEQFYRLDTARSSKNGGAGLGLAIAKEIVELHHGTISAHSEDGITCFEVQLPLS